MLTPKLPDVKSANDWHLISAHEVRKHGGSTLLRHYGSIVKAAYLLLPKENNIVQPLKAPTYRVPTSICLFISANIMKADLHSRLKSIFEEYSIETNASYDDFVYSSNTSFRVGKYSIVIRCLIHCNRFIDTEFGTWVSIS